MRYTSRAGGWSYRESLGVVGIGESKMSDGKKRYKTLFIFKCVSAHQTLWMDHALANSPEEAQKISSDRIREIKCKSCGQSIIGVSAQGTEETSRYSIYLVLGYTCHCGERVSVFREEIDKSIGFPDEITVECLQGHSRRILNQEFLSLERWEEQTN